jgi:hypothetical protein
MARSFKMAAEQLARDITPGRHVVPSAGTGATPEQLAKAVTKALNGRVEPHGLSAIQISSEAELPADLGGVAFVVCVGFAPAAAIPVECVIVVQEDVQPVQVWTSSRGVLGILEFSRA